MCERERAQAGGALGGATELNGSKIFLALEAFANECRKSLHLVRGEARRRADGGRKLAKEAMLIPRSGTGVVDIENCFVVVIKVFTFRGALFWSVA